MFKAVMAFGARQTTGLCSVPQFVPSVVIQVFAHVFI